MLLVVVAIFIAITFKYQQDQVQDQVQDQDAGETIELPDYLYTNASKDDIVVDILEGQTITSPLTITGQARGSWFFEATAPVVIVNWDGLIIAQGYIQTTDDWMTEEFVPFVGTLEFEKPSYGDNGAIILQADNPSDLPEFDKALEIPILF
ncbi:Gmad2 immunoglobulin-like domain-containing protein [Patescibacteria group bacterium]|nr:Gmad2 immunoglobulin-like domain-containing protein [Patescibacteria group bacterium]